MSRSAKCAPPSPRHSFSSSVQLTHFRIHHLSCFFRVSVLNSAPLFRLQARRSRLNGCAVGFLPEAIQANFDENACSSRPQACSSVRTLVLVAPVQVPACRIIKLSPTSRPAGPRADGQRMMSRLHYSVQYSSTRVPSFFLCVLQKQTLGTQQNKPLLRSMRASGRQSVRDHRR